MLLVNRSSIFFKKGYFTVSVITVLGKMYYLFFGEIFVFYNCFFSMKFIDISFVFMCLCNYKCYCILFDFYLFCYLLKFLRCYVFKQYTHI